MAAHLLALAQSLLFFLVLGLSCYGWGRAALRVLHVEGDGIELVWAGWASVLLMLQSVHLFLPLTIGVAGPLFGIGVMFSIPGTRRLRLPRVRWFVADMVIATWVASRAMRAPSFYDTGLYHLATIRWINSFRIVPGLGNLHSRLGFNQSFFLWVGALNLHPYFDQGRAIANSFLFLLTVATLIQQIRGSGQVLRRTLALLLLPAVGYLAVFTDGLASPTPDFPSWLLQVVMLVFFGEVIADWSERKEPSSLAASILTILAATAITVKLSNLAFACVIAVVVLALTRRELRLARVIPAAIVLSIWVLRGYVLTGAPLFPSSFGHVPVDWAVPVQQAHEVTEVIRGFARSPGPNALESLRGWNWLRPWSRHVWIEETGVVVYPIAVGFLFCAGAAVAGRLRREWTLLAPVVLGLLYWFFTAPDPRFAHALFFGFSSCAAALFLIAIGPRMSGRTSTVALVTVFLVANVTFAYYAVRFGGVAKDVAIAGFQQPAPAPLIRKSLASGLVVFVPASGAQCWDAPLPCTPEIDPTLRLRVTGKLGSGFMVKRAAEAR